jgi:hypothetical protein
LLPECASDREIGSSRPSRRRRHRRRKTVQGLDPQWWVVSCRSSPRRLSFAMSHEPPLPLSLSVGPVLCLCSPPPPPTVGSQIPRGFPAALALVPRPGAETSSPGALPLRKCAIPARQLTRAYASLSSAPGNRILKSHGVWPASCFYRRAHSHPGARIRNKNRLCYA